MRFFEWLNGPKQTEVERALSLLKKQDKCSTLKEDQNAPASVYLIGSVKPSSLLFPKKKIFSYYTVRFAHSGNEAMVSSRGTVDFFFSTPEEVEALKQGIINHFK